MLSPTNSSEALETLRGRVSRRRNPPVYRVANGGLRRANLPYLLPGPIQGVYS